MSDILPRFKVGDKVAAIALPNGFPKPLPRRAGFVVKTVTRMRCDAIPTYYRVYAIHPLTLASVEGAERFFEPEGDSRV